MVWVGHVHSHLTINARAAYSTWLLLRSGGAFRFVVVAAACR